MPLLVYHKVYTTALAVRAAGITREERRCSVAYWSDRPASGSESRMNTLLRITGGRVYDPANGIDGQIRDICIAGGRIVPEVDGGRTIDARGRIVFPGGVDIHAHMVGGKVNFARKMHPEDHRRMPPLARTAVRRSGVGTTLPSTFATGYLYAGIGWTTVFDAAVGPILARHAHEELHDVPIVDKGFYVLMGNNEILLDILAAGELERARHFVAWLLWAAKAYAVKLVNPGGVAAWKFGGNARGLSQPIEPFGVSPRQIISALARIVDDLGLPHPVHIHCNNLGLPGNYATTLETMTALEGHRAHMAHLQFHCYGGEGWGTFSSKAAAVAEYFNSHPNLTADVGQVLFGLTTTLTADGPWQHLLYRLTKSKWSNLDQEMEEGCGIVPYVYRERSLVNAVQWAVGLELLLLARDPWRIYLSTDHPNGAIFTRYPHIIRLLMDADYRREALKRLPTKAVARTLLPDLDREYSLYEIAIITRAGPALALGLQRKGHLGIGADADVVIYDPDPDVERMFANPRYVIKGGEVILEDGEIGREIAGQTFLVHPPYDEDVEVYLRGVFDRYYTVAFDNYPVEMGRVHSPEVVPCR